MEILRFEQVPESAPQRKKSSRGFLALGLVAALFGISTAFASSTIQINTDNKVALGQGVVTVSGCDTNIGFNPVTELTADASTFKIRKLEIGYDYDGTKAGNVDTNTVTGCGGKAIKITLYKDKTAPATGVDKVLCKDTYGGSAGAGASISTSVAIGDSRDANPYNLKVPYRCDADGSFYYQVSFPAGAFAYPSVAIYYMDGTTFRADAFDHVTIESVDINGRVLNGQND
jgi:hypothetical protein